MTTATLHTAQAAGTRDPRSFLPDTVWEREVQLIMREGVDDHGLAERILGQTIAYFVACGENPDLILGPSPMVDKGVHAVMLDTPTFMRFTYGHFGRYIHHIPDLTSGDCDSGDDGLCVQKAEADGHDRDGNPLLARTVAAIRGCGFAVDDEMWPPSATSDCNQCHAGCHDSPK